MIIMIEHSTVMKVLSQYLGQDILSVRFESGRKEPKITVFAEVADPAAKVTPMAQAVNTSAIHGPVMSQPVDDENIHAYQGELDFEAQLAEEYAATHEDEEELDQQALTSEEFVL